MVGAGLLGPCRDGPCPWSGAPPVANSRHAWLPFHSNIQGCGRRWRRRQFAEEEGKLALPEQRLYGALHYFDSGTAPPRAPPALAVRR
jgi:hypothetical protein